MEPWALDHVGPSSYILGKREMISVSELFARCFQAEPDAPNQETKPNKRCQVGGPS